MNYLFGPVNSRRLGFSQGIDLLPAKVCNLNCIYCEVGPTTRLTCDRDHYTPTAEIIAELDQLLADPAAVARIDHFTITANGEPTLHKGLGAIIRHLKSHTDKPVAVLTNGTLLHLAEVREELMAADLVIPSLDAARAESFRRVDRPARCVELDQVIAGLKTFRQEFGGTIWLEILLVKGINDAEADIAALLSVVDEIRPDRIQLNTVARPPLEAFARPLSQEELTTIAQRFGERAEVIVDFSKKTQEGFRPIIEAEIIQLLRRRPCTAPDICTALQIDPADIGFFLKNLEEAGKIQQKIHNDRRYYQTKPE